MYTRSYEAMSPMPLPGMKGWADVLSEVLPAATQSAANIVRIFKPQASYSYPSIANPSGGPAIIGTVAGGISQYLPLILLGGIAIFAFSQMRKP